MPTHPTGVPSAYQDQYDATEELRELFERMPLPPASTFIDLGCGAGPALVEAAKFSPRLIVGVDLDEAGLAVAKSMLAQSGVRHVLVRADITSLPFAAGTFSHACARLSLPYVDQRSAFGELARVLKPGGAAFLQLHAFRFYWEELWRERRQWKRLMINAFCLLNGLVFTLTGRQLRIQRRGGSYQELAQSVMATTRSLARAGLERTWLDTGKLFRILAIRRGR